MSQDSVDLVPGDEMRGVIDDIRIAEAQIARGGGVEHHAARARVLSRLLRQDNPS